VLFIVLPSVECAEPNAQQQGQLYTQPAPHVKFSLMTERKYGVSERSP
jgi:hypothetical protein